MKCYFSDDVASGSKDEKQLSRARREAAANKKKKEASKQKGKKTTFWKAPLPEKILKSIANHTKNAALGITQNLTKSVVPAEKGMFNISTQIKEPDTIINSELKPSLFVQDIIHNGYIKLFTTIPLSFYAPNNKSSLRNSRSASQAISKLLKENVIEELDKKPYCCNPLTVAGNIKLRLVLDHCHANSFKKQNKFWYENLTTLSKILSEGDYFITFDLSSDYDHIKIHLEYCKFLGFE